MTEPAFELEKLKSRLKETWKAGDFGQIAKTLEPTAEQFVARRAIQPGMRVLDVACGTGNLSIPAAKAGAIVSGIDIAPNLLEQARERAKQASLSAEFKEGDAEQLSYPDATFDLVMTMFGAMFAPRPNIVAAELIRVCKPNGQIAMANWTPRGFVGQMFKLTASHIPPPPGVQPPSLWGDEATVRERLKEGVSDLKMTPVMAVTKYPYSPAELVEFFRTFFGPIKLAFESLPEEKRAVLRRDLEDLWTKHNEAKDGTVLLHVEYLEVVATRSK